jgi:hypothetical protein
LVGLKVVFSFRQLSAVYWISGKLYQCFILFLANFRNLVTNRKGAGKSNKGIFEILKNKSPYVEKNNLEVTRFRQFVTQRLKLNTHESYQLNPKSRFS